MHHSYTDIILCLLILSVDLHSRWKEEGGELPLARFCCRSLPTIIIMHTWVDAYAHACLCVLFINFGKENNRAERRISVRCFEDCKSTNFYADRGNFFFKNTVATLIHKSRHQNCQICNNLVILSLINNLVNAIFACKCKSLLLLQLLIR